MYKAYGIASGTVSELDHLVPLELGGANDVANLWPEIGKLPNPKDKVENDLREEVCSGKVSLAAAQKAIAADWMTAEAQLGVS
ncbi:HNH endonuclease signature motif containing protein [Actinospica robiniae]|uniref:HNH endonuclease signature motif containing protein n=1 Tax=Actinospica robiniae TaxID=304901 RepID=UPI0004060119|nr:HNH endonuclease signature motif containing protein [Actinospica robiniae]